MSDKKQEVLEACPFCGGENIQAVWLGGLWKTVCDKCGSSGGLCETEAESVAAWNTRPSPWVEITDDPKSLPETGSCWFCYGKTGYTYNGHYDATYKLWQIFDPCGEYLDVHHNDPPTHWQPIELPERSE